MDIDERVNPEKENCSLCSYFQNDSFCIRKKQACKSVNYCLHFTDASNLHSIDHLTTEIDALLKGQ